MPDTEINAKQVKELREKTAAPVMDCKKALLDASGDMEKAAMLLREKGLARAKKRKEKAADQGAIEAYIHIGRQIGSLVELNCETDFVARSGDFLELAHEIALQVAACNPLYIDIESVPQRVIDERKRTFSERCEAEGKPREVWDRIIEGRLEKFYEEVCLLEQPYVKEPSMTIGELVDESSARLGEKLKINRFSRFQVAEKEQA